MFSKVQQQIQMQTVPDKDTYADTDCTTNMQEQCGGKYVLGELQRFRVTLDARWVRTQVGIDNIESFQLRTLQMDSIIQLGIAILQYFGM